MKIRTAVPVIIGFILLLVGIGWASQGVGIIGGSSLMDNNPTFIYLGGIVAVIGIALIAFGVVPKKNTRATASMQNQQTNTATDY